MFIKTLMILVVAAAATGCVQEKEVCETMSTNVSEKILMVIAPENFRDEELLEPKRIFEDSGVTVTIASTSTDVARGMLGATVKPDVAIADVNISEYNGIAIVGGGGSKKYLWDSVELRQLVVDANEQNMVVSAICLSPVVLARAGVLDGRKCTVFQDPESIRELEECGAVYVNQDVIVSDNVITGRDPRSARLFARAVLDAI
jgi:protease I